MYRCTDLVCTMHLERSSPSIRTILDIQNFWLIKISPHHGPNNYTNFLNTFPSLLRVDCLMSPRQNVNIGSERQVHYLHMWMIPFPLTSTSSPPYPAVRTRECVKCFCSSLVRDKLIFSESVGTNLLVCQQSFLEILYALIPDLFQPLSIKMSPQRSI